MRIIGIDIGGTKISVCLGTNKGNILDSIRFKTQAHLGYKQALQNTLDAIYDLLQKHALTLKKIAAVGISCPGPVDTKKGKLLNPPNLKGWEYLPIVEFFKRKLKRPIFMNNDANAAALAVWHFGGHKVNDLLYLTASTGMGGGIIIDGKLLQGFTDTAGEVGHFIIEANGRKCPCGQKGCFEAYCGGKMFAKYVQQKIVREKPKTSLKPTHLDMQAIVEAVKKRDAFAKKMFKEFIEKLAIGIGTLLMVLNPELVVLGTIAIHAGKLLLDPLKEALKKTAWPEPRKAKIIASRLRTHVSEKSALAVAMDGLQSHTK